MGTLSQYRVEIGKMPQDLIAQSKQDVGDRAEHTAALFALTHPRATLLGSLQTKRQIFDLLIQVNGNGQTTLDQIVVPPMGSTAEEGNTREDVITAICDTTAEAFLRTHAQDHDLISTLREEARKAGESEVQDYVTIQILGWFFPTLFPPGHSG